MIVNFPMSEHILVQTFLIAKVSVSDISNAYASEQENSILQTVDRFTWGVAGGFCWGTKMTHPCHHKPVNTKYQHKKKPPYPPQRKSVETFENTAKRKQIVRKLTVITTFTELFLSFFHRILERQITVKARGLHQPSFSLHWLDHVWGEPPKTGKFPGIKICPKKAELFPKAELLCHFFLGG
eukprot:g10374.t1